MQPSTSLRSQKEAYAKALHERYLREERKRQSNPRGGLLHFVRYFWHVLEPTTPLVEGWALSAVCYHLEAVTRGEINRLLINVPPGFMKSLLVNVFWPAWHWSAQECADHRFVTFSYAAYLTERDNGKFRDILRSRAFKELWGGAFKLTEDGKVRVVNDKTGWKFASSIKGVGTGERGNVVILDDPHNVKEGEYENIRAETVRWVREGMSNRLNDIESGAIIIIMQRVHEDDVSGAVVADDLGYVHLMIPMEFDPARKCVTAIGWEDPREEDGELAWPERFPAHSVANLRRTLGPYAYAGQYQQSPHARGGNILKDSWWQYYEMEIGAKPRHRFEYVVASLDPAFTKQQENDPSGFTVWALYRENNGQAKILLIHAWEKWLDLHGQVVDRREGEDARAYMKRAQPEWGLVEWVGHDCTRLRVDKLLIENKASGHSVSQEIRRLYADRNWGVQLVDPGGMDKRARAYAVQHLFADGMVGAPASVVGDNLRFREWAELVVTECAKFRGLDADKDNLVDSVTQALKHLRDIGLAVRREEKSAADEDLSRHRKSLDPIYPA